MQKLRSMRFYIYFAVDEAKRIKRHPRNRGFDQDHRLTWLSVDKRF